MKNDHPRHPASFRGRSSGARRFFGAHTALMLVVAASLAGCAEVPTKDAGTSRAPAATREEAADGVTTALEYHRLLATAAPAELVSERAALNNAPATPLVLVRQAILLSHPERPINLPRALALLGAVAAQRTPDAIALHPLVRLLSDQLAERQRLEATAERLTQQLERVGQQLKESQRSGEQLREKLDALTEIERTLPTPPGASSQPAPLTSPRKPPR